jgi:ATP-binding cassette, subfamily B, bacterial
VHWKTLAQLIQHKVRMQSYSHLLSLDQRFHEGQQSGNLIAVVNDDVNQLERFLDGGINDLIQVTVTVIVIGAIYFFKSPMLALLSFITMPLIIYGSVWFQKFLVPLYAGVRDQVGLLTTELNNNLQGMSTIRSFAREKESLARMNEFSMGYFSTNEKAIHMSSMFTPLIRILVMIGFLMTLLVGGRMTLQGELDVGTYSVLIFLIQRLLWPLTRLGQTLDLFQRAMASVTRIFNLLDIKPQILSGGLALAKENIRGKIQFKNVSFSYEGKGSVFENFNLSVNAGESFGLVGSTGSGKTSLIKLLQRFYDPLKGKIYLDDRPLEEYALNDLRSAISVVSQDVYLFHGTIRENLQFAKPNATEDEMIRACQAAQIHDSIQSLPQGYSTLVGERGQRLSGGQKQRLSIARSILADSPIVILDEATSAVDNLTEARLQVELEKFLEGRTSVVIAHRLSTVVHCDRIVVLEEGRIVEEGTHKQLSQSKGVYHSLWSIQTGSEL